MWLWFDITFSVFFKLEQYEEYLSHVSTTINRLYGLKVFLNKNKKAFLFKYILCVSCACDMEAESEW